MKKIKFTFIILFIMSFCGYAYCNDDFEKWKIKFKIYAKEQGISSITLDQHIDKSKFLPDVIKYDRYQPEFYEDTKTYISKRASNKKLKIGYKIYLNNADKINSISKRFDVDKNLLLSLMGIETNFGNYLGKMDIISSLATLSFDKRRSVFFTSELITLLKLIDNKIVDPNTLFGSWAGAFGNFQFMPSTIKNYALDYDNNNIIELKKIEDSFASAANYINKIGWKKNGLCFKKITLSEDIPKKFLNTSAKKIKNKTSIRKVKKYISQLDKPILKNKDKIGIITPDKDIIPEADNLSPAYIVFDNYELVLKWNRSLRFALAVCTLKEKIANEL